jgi:L-seryl-tRNA(Ser) seleniumtransferase
MADKGNKKVKLSKFPSISSVLEDDRLRPAIKKWSFAFVSGEVKKLAAVMKRSAARSGNIPSKEDLIDGTLTIFGKYDEELIRPVINGTGVLLHTNLGRAPIDPQTYDGLKNVMCGYSNLEFDVASNRRSKRGMMAGRMIAALSGTEAGMVVNNNAAAVYIIVADLAAGKEVIVSRGQLVQIGGGFRIPEIIERSGAIMKEVGTTNKTLLGDYRKAIGKNTGLILVVHKSNFIQRGFTEEPEVSRIAELAGQKKVPVCYDLGSGLLSPIPGVSSLDEPDVGSAVRTGADLVCFSGDKLLGGPQAGLIVGKERMVTALLKNPLYRVVRADKLTIGLLERTLISYLRDDHDSPYRKMASTSVQELRSRAESIVEKLDSSQIRVIDLKSSFGGGSSPGFEFESCGIKIEGNPSSISQRLREAPAPVISRSSASGVSVDLRTVFPHQDKDLLEAVRSCL